MTKYKEYVQKMLDENNELFSEFKNIHDLYLKDEEKWQDKFNTEGAIVVDILREYENRLCANTERGMYNKFSAGLAEKFQDEVKKHFPLIDHIGLKTQKKIQLNDDFNLKKINF